MKTLAETLQHNHELIAGLVSAYQQHNNLDDRQLRQLLEIDEFGLARLVLLKRPLAGVTRETIRDMARSVGCSERALRSVLAAQEVTS